MLKQEFSDRTGFYPSADMYAIIENKYLEMDVGKDRFCKMYKNNDEGLAEYIQSAADKETVTMLDEMTKKVKEEKEALQCRIRILESGSLGCRVRTPLQELPEPYHLGFHRRG